jgi:hypothetical protein
MTRFPLDVIYETKKAGSSAKNQGQGRQSGPFDSAACGQIA